MNEQIVACPNCGNTEIFVELVWEQRRYHIDGAGETLYTSDPIEGTEFLIEKFCKHCWAIIEKKEIKPPGAIDDGFWEFWKNLPHYWEELPAYTDSWDESGNYHTQFKDFFVSKNSDFDLILEEYDLAPERDRIMINWLFIRLCGYSLPSIIKKAHGYEPDAKEPEGDKS